MSLDRERAVVGEKVFAVHEELPSRLESRIGQVELPRNVSVLFATVFVAGELAGLESHAGFERNSQFLDELKHFFACIDGSETPRVSLADGAQSLRMALAARQSLTSGKVIELT